MNKARPRQLTDYVVLIFAVSGVVLTFLFQDFSFLDALILSGQSRFIARKILRVFLNDLFMLIFIATWFKDRQVTRFAFYVQLIDGLFLLPLYLSIKIAWEGTSEISSPLLSQLHRLIINPTLMILLIPAVYFQKLHRKDE
jgi:exosortase F-associated protein